MSRGPRRLLRPWPRFIRETHVLTSDPNQPATTPIAPASGKVHNGTSAHKPAPRVADGVAKPPANVPGGDEGGQAPMQTFKGLPVSDGIVIGKVLVVGADARRVGRIKIKPAQVAAEIARFDAAVEASKHDISLVFEKAEREMGRDAANIFLFHKGMLSDPAVVGKVREAIKVDLLRADSAVNQVLGEYAAHFRRAGDSVFATKVNDIDDLSIRLMGHLEGAPSASGPKATDDNTIVIATDLTPSQTIGFDRAKVKGFATDLGGKTSHTAILAKALELPAVVGCQTLVKYATDGMSIILDGELGTVILNPDEAALAQYRRLIEQQREFLVELGETCSLPSITTDDVAVHVVGNIELPEEVSKVVAAGGEGVGLYRTEYLYLTSDKEPSEEDQYRAYRKCVELVGGQELVIRTMDLGADKYTQSREVVPERNPFLGNRSIRYCLRDLPMFKTQLRAILRASALGPIKVMFPLVTSIGELRQAKFVVNDVMEELEEEGIPFDRALKIGMMVEVPSAAIQAEAFAREVDFFSIGTNDLVQYTLAVDRINERVAHLYQPTHPAVIRLIRDVARVARRHKIPVSCCGEAAGELEYAMLLIGLGLRTLSVTSSSIPQLKRFIRSISVQQCERTARQALTLDSDVQITALLRDRARKFVPDAFDGRSVE